MKRLLSSAGSSGVVFALLIVLSLFIGRPVADAQFSTLPKPPGATGSVFDLYYQQVVPRTGKTASGRKVIDYVRNEMRTWYGKGVVLERSDVVAAIHADIKTLCNGKKNTAGEDMEFIVGGMGDSGSCEQMRSDILSLIQSEQRAEELGRDLLAISLSGEAAISGTPGRPVNMPRALQTLERLWSSTGSVVLAWPESANDELKELKDELLKLKVEDDMDDAILRFRYGLLRDTTENSVALQAVAQPIKTKLQALATALGIRGDTSNTGNGEYIVPLFTDDALKNVTLWARADDLGLDWVYPTHIERDPVIKNPARYPFIAGSVSLTQNNPFGDNAPSAREATPLCERTMAKEGYLCRPIMRELAECNQTDSNAIELVSCNRKTVVTPGVPLCTDLVTSMIGSTILYKNKPSALADSKNAQFVNELLSPADVKDVCGAGTRVLYKDELLGHACYVDLCLQQAMSGHTLQPGRNPTLSMELTAPYLGMMRPNPKLGMYMEVPRNVPIGIPQYLGPELVTEFETQFCAQSGKLPKGLPAACTYDKNRRAASPDTGLPETVRSIFGEGSDLAGDNQLLSSLAVGIGQRAAFEQFLGIKKRTMDSLAVIAQTTADLLKELKRAPLTDDMCPAIFTP